MKIELYRYSDTNEYTKGAMIVDGVFECFTLEDPERLEKIDGETAIPKGTYPIALRTEDSPMNQTYADKFEGRHKGMLWLLNVPMFTWVYIHIGNYLRDTDGCILTGNRHGGGEAFVGDSTNAYITLYDKVVAAIEAGETVTIEIK